MVAARPSLIQVDTGLIKLLFRAPWSGSLDMATHTAANVIADALAEKQPGASIGTVETRDSVKEPVGTSSYLERTLRLTTGTLAELQMLQLLEDAFSPVCLYGCEKIWATRYNKGFELRLDLKPCDVSHINGVLAADTRCGRAVAMNTWGQEVEGVIIVNQWQPDTCAASTEQQLKDYLLHLCEVTRVFPTQGIPIID